jgi:hypothetical protein
MPSYSPHLQEISGDLSGRAADLGDHPHLGAELHMQRATEEVIVSDRTSSSYHMEGSLCAQRIPRTQSAPIRKTCRTRYFAACLPIGSDDQSWMDKVAMQVLEPWGIAVPVARLAVLQKHSLNMNPGRQDHS